MKVLMIDNYDSFTYNLVHLFEQLGAEVVTFRNDALSVDDAVALEADRLVISPGPGRPEDAGASVELLRRLGPTTRSLGVCLGHQAIVQAYGGEIGQAHALLHGKASHIRHDGRGVFGGLPEDVLLGWAWNYVAWRKGARLITGDPAVEIERPRDLHDKSAAQR